MDDPFDLPPDLLRRVPLFAEIAKVMAWREGPVNWDLARQVAVSVAAGQDPSQQVDPATADAFAEHVRSAHLWLAETTGLPPSGVTAVRAVTPVDWVEQAATAFRELIDPVAAKASGAITEQLPGIAGADADQLRQVMGQLGPMFMGIQVGTVIGQLAVEVLGTHEITLPVDEPAVLLIAPAIDRLADDHTLDRRAVRQWVALQAAARQPTLNGPSWVRAHFFALYHNLVTTLDVSIGDGLQQLQQLDLSDPSKIQDAIAGGGLFSAEPSPATAAAAGRLGRFLAVIDAYETVAVETAGARLGADALGLAELFARRAAEPGPARRGFGSFIGLDETADRPAALAFVRGVLARSDWAMLGRMWEDAGSFPTDEEIGAPERWVERMGS